MKSRNATPLIHLAGHIIQVVPPLLDQVPVKEEVTAVSVWCMCQKDEPAGTDQLSISEFVCVVLPPYLRHQGV